MIFAITNARRLAGRVTAQFALIAPDNEAITKTLCPGPMSVVRTLREMRSDHLLPFAFLDASDVSGFSTTSATTATTSAGAFDSLIRSGDQFILAGWAWLPDRGRLADAVLLTSPDSAGIEQICAIVFRDRENRPELLRIDSKSVLARSGWSRTLDASQLTDGARISAWAFDTYACRAYRLDGTHIVPSKAAR